MKRITYLTCWLVGLSAVPVLAQQQLNNNEDMEVLLFSLNAIAILLSVWIAASFVLTLIRLFLNDRLRRMLVERNASPEVSAEILPKADKLPELALKWCCVFLSTGIGLTICYFTGPMGIHWAIIMSFSLAGGLLGYYLIGKERKR